MMAGSEVLSARVEDGVALITLGSPTRIFFDPEMSDALLEAMTALAGDEAVRVLVVTGGAPGYFVRHYSVVALISMGERLNGSGQQWSEDTPYTPGSFAKAMHLAEQMPKPVIAAISGTAMGGGFEFTLACDIRIAQQGDFQIGLPEVNIGILPGGGGTQRLPRVIGTPAALMHILMGVTLSPVEAAQKGFVHEAVAGKALDRAMEIANRLASHTPQSIRAIKRLIRNAVETPLDQGLQLERNLFMDLCGGARRLHGCALTRVDVLPIPLWGYDFEREANRLFSIVDRDVQSHSRPE
jgi:enoyl-CoA hydratase/carnithine racemase